MRPVQPIPETTAILSGGMPESFIALMKQTITIPRPQPGHHM
jgi:hypothetical protein